MWHYIQHIESITLEESGDGELTVILDTDADDNLLTVVYTGTYGVQNDSATVKDGKAVLTGLTPDTQYTIEVVIDGFHKLTGSITKKYTSPNEVTVNKFIAKAGNRDGEIILSFDTDAPDSAQWFVTYTDDSGNTREEQVTDHTITIMGLTVGNTYTFALNSPDADNLLGETEVSFTAKAFIQAEDLTVTGCINHNLSFTWTSPENVTVSSWTVRCVGANGFDETKNVTTESVTFTVPDETLSYSLEVIADGMSQGVTTRSPANAVTVADMTVDDSDPLRLKLTWSAYGNIPKGGWILTYTIDGMPQPEIQTSEMSAEVFPLVPDSEYRFTLMPVDDIVIMGGITQYTAPTVAAFEGHGLVASDMEFTICCRPDSENWNRNQIKAADKRTEFTTDEKIGFLVRTENTYNPDEDALVVLYVIRDTENNLIEISTTTGIWGDMWSRGHCVLNIPNTPAAPGAYTVAVYFNGAYVTSIDFTIIN